MKLKNIIFGSPIPNAKQQEQKLGFFSGFAILSSNSLSSVSYATGEIFIVLATIGSFAIINNALNISFFIIALILLLGFSYIQVIRAYPNGGGSYSIVKDNFNEKALLLTTASLIIDYILTVAVSISSASLAISSTFPLLKEHIILISLILLAFITIINLRGVRSTAKVFVWPTYMFIFIILLMIGLGIYKDSNNAFIALSHSSNVNTDSLQEVIGLTILLKAFSSGTPILTGIESYANGISTYKNPTVKNAVIGLIIMTILLMLMFWGITFLAIKTHIILISKESVLSQIGHDILGNGFLYYFLQISTFLILLMAANTCFTGFPTLAAIISKDGYLPKQLQNVGDRLAFKNGIIVLSLISAIFIILFNANVNLLIPLYAFGVFIAFTLCQAGLVKYWYTYKRKFKYWGISAFLNIIGCVVTFLVILTILESKFFNGGWIVIIAIISIMMILYKIKNHYISREEKLALSTDQAVVEMSINKDTKPKIIVLVSKIHKGTIQALILARNLSDDITPIYVSSNEDKTVEIKEQWKNLHFKEKLLVLRPKYNSLIVPILDAIHKNDIREVEKGRSIIVIPEVVNTKWWYFFLHNQKSSMLKMSINAMDKKDKIKDSRIIISVPFKSD